MLNHFSISEKKKKVVNLAFRLGTFVLAIYLAGNIVGFEEIAQNLSQVNFFWIIILTVICLLNLIIVSKRWQTLLNQGGQRTKFIQVFGLNYTGFFFNNFAPGGVGGEVYKVIRGGSKEVTKSIVQDKAANYLALFIWFGICSLFFLKLYVALPIVAVLAILCWYYFQSKIKYVAPNQGPLVVVTFSLISMLLLFLQFYLSFIALGSSVPLTSFLLSFPLILLASVLPVSIGGWGLREGAALALLSAENEVILSASILFGLVTLLTSLPGLLMIHNRFDYV